MRATVAGVMLAVCAMACSTQTSTTIVGPCTLQVRSISDESTQVDLVLPYTTALRRGDLVDEVGEQALFFQGSGWGQTAATVTRPDNKSSVANLTADDLSDGTLGIPVTASGTWRFRLVSEGCVREVVVEVRPAPPLPT